METQRLLAAIKAALAGGPPYMPDAVSPAPAPPRLPAPAAWPGGRFATWPEGTAILAPTSGSTGRPRWVALSAAALRASAEASAAALGGVGNWLLALPADRIAGINVLVRAVLADAALVALGPGPFTAKAFAAAAEALPPGPRYTSLVPTQLARVLAGPAEARRALAAF
ncbi:MAG: hypothetical protein LBD90_01845, partial [Bifidobacteriaceae bacterium]|nr:hypothetical protein [Bifidobacteriaceae bacterium]